MSLLSKICYLRISPVRIQTLVLGEYWLRCASVWASIHDRPQFLQLERAVHHCGKCQSRYLIGPDNFAPLQCAIKDIRWEQCTIHNPSPGDVLLAMNDVGICGSNMHYLMHGRIGSIVFKQPNVIERKVASTMAQVSKSIKYMREFGPSSRLWEYCKTGNYNVCTNKKFCDPPPNDSNLTRVHKHMDEFCYKLFDYTMEGVRAIEHFRKCNKIQEHGGRVCCTAADVCSEAVSSIYAPPFATVIVNGDLCEAAINFK